MSTAPSGPVPFFLIACCVHTVRFNASWPIIVSVTVTKSGAAPSRTVSVYATANDRASYTVPARSVTTSAWVSFFISS